MDILKSAFFSLCCMTLSGVALADANSGPQMHKFLDRPFMELVGFIEAPDGYDDITGFTDRKPVKNVTEMTIAEVLDFQRMLRQQGAQSSAMGRFQFVYKTLDYVTKKHRIDRNSLFDEAMQDRLARMEMERCGFYDPEADIHELGNCLAATWAALPVLTGKQRGKSRYASTGINGARTTPEIVEAVLRARFFTRKIAPQKPPEKNGFKLVNASYVSQVQESPRDIPNSSTAPSASVRPKLRPNSLMQKHVD